MMDTLQNKLDPARFPNMSVEFAAMVGYLLDRQFTEPVLAELSVTADGHVTGAPAAGDGIGHALHMGTVSELRGNLRRLGMAADLDEFEWAELSRLIKVRIGMDFDGPGVSP